MPAGRPTKLTPAVIEASKHYRDNYAEVGDVIPSVAGLADELKIDRTTLYDWSLKDEGEFPNIYRQILAKQERVLVNGGLSGTHNSTITKLMLTKHGYSDKQELTGNDGEKLIPDGFIINHVSAGS